MFANDSSRTIIHYHHYHSLESVNKPTVIAEIAIEPYDSAGAALFIIVVLLWFSLGIVCMLGVQIRARAETIEDCAQRRAKLFITSLRDQTQKKQILGRTNFFSEIEFDFHCLFSEELADKEKRDKLWDIYLGKMENKKEKLKRAEHLRIRNIQKQLAVINRNRLIMNDTVVTPTAKYVIRRSVSESRSTFVSHLIAFEEPSSNRRRSSFDEQTLGRWKTAVNANQSSVNECLSETRKRNLSRYFRRSEINPLGERKPRDTSVIDLSADDEHRQLLRPLTKKSNERLNPYITYFQLPTHKTLPSVTINSDHQIIQMNVDECQC